MKSDVAQNFTQTIQENPSYAQELPNITLEIKKTWWQSFKEDIGQGMKDLATRAFDWISGLFPENWTSKVDPEMGFNMIRYILIALGIVLLGAALWSVTQWLLGFKEKRSLMDTAPKNSQQDYQSRAFWELISGKPLPYQAIAYWNYFVWLQKSPEGMTPKEYFGPKKEPYQWIDALMFHPPSATQNALDKLKRLASKEMK